LLCQLEQSQESRIGNKEVENDDNDFEDDDEEGDCGGCFIVDEMAQCRSGLGVFCRLHRYYIRIALLVVLVLLYFAYFIYALNYEFGDEGSIRLLWITCLVVFILLLKLLFWFLREYCGTCADCAGPICSFIRRHYKLINWFVALLI